MRIAKVFRNGASQAVRLPKEFRFDGDEICIKRVGSAVLLFPRNTAWDLMGDALGKTDVDFMASRNQAKHADKRRSLAGARSK
jgi:antitoxin VapB